MTQMVRVDGHFDTEPHKVVLKWTIMLGPDPVVVPIPRGARLLHVEFIQGREPLTGRFLLWYEVELREQENMMNHIMQIIATGVQIPKTLKHLGSGTAIHNGINPAEVWHLYEYPSGAKLLEV